MPRTRGKYYNHVLAFLTSLQRNKGPIIVGNPLKGKDEEEVKDKFSRMKRNIATLNDMLTQLLVKIVLEFEHEEHKVKDVEMEYKIKIEMEECNQYRTQINFYVEAKVDIKLYAR